MLWRKSTMKLGYTSHIIIFLASYNNNNSSTEEGL